MFYVIVSGLIATIGLALWYFLPLVLDVEAGPDAAAKLASARRTFRVVIALFVLAVEGLFTVFNSYYQIPTGHVGVVYRFGGIVSQRPEGLQWVPPWESVMPASIQTQRHHFPKLGTFSKQTQDVFIAATINIRVSPKAIQQLYRTVGPNYFNVLVAPKVNQFLKDETVKYDTVQIAPHREELRSDVKKRLNDALGVDSIEVVDFLIDDIDFRGPFKQSIEDKQIATQRALKEQQLIKVKQFKADQQRAEAQGDADAILIRAKQQAHANDLLAKSITNELIRYQTIQKLAPNVSVMLVPGGEQFILGSDLLARATKK